MADQLNLGITFVNPSRKKRHSSQPWELSESHHTVKTFLEDFSRKVDCELKTGPTEARNNTWKNLSQVEHAALDRKAAS